MILRTYGLLSAGVAAMALGLGLTAPAQAREQRDYRPADERREERQEERWEQYRRVHDRREFSHPAAHWRFERGRGWRFERRPGYWSPHYSWWWIDGRVVLLGAPTLSVVQYPSGRYELRGDGVSVPYHWVWIPTRVVVVPPAPPAPPAVPAPPGPFPAPPPPPPGG